ncbi:MAG: hypothetical protein IJ762_06075 [Bacteroidaceae bacterium]|nr:hypothetical protein [Bacteroidaceae bacterium]
MKRSSMKHWLTMSLLAMAGLFTACSSDDENSPKEPDVPILSEIDYDLSESAVVVPAATSNKYENVDTEGHTFVIPSSVSEDQVPTVGQCLIVNTPSEALPDGLLAKVKNVQETSNGYLVTYEDAELGEAFERIDIPEQAIPLGDHVEHVYNAKGEEIEFNKVWSTRATGEASTKLELPEIGWDLPGGLSFTPQMTVDLTLKYVMQFQDHIPVYVGALVDAEAEVGASLSLSADGDAIDYHADLLTIVCGAIPIGPIVITPTISVHAIFKVGGGVSLEASVSYKRTFHAKAIYQDGQGVTATATLDPEAPDAWSFSFGPKLEGYVQYGLGIGPHIAIYAKALSVGCMLNVSKKEAISAKFDLASLADGEWSFMDSNFKNPEYSSSLVYDLKGYLMAIGKPIKEFDGPEVSKTLDTRPVFPEFTIDEKKFIKRDKNKVTLTMEMMKKGLLYGKYRAEWIPTDKNEKTIVQYFNFDENKKALLETGATTEITCTATLKDDVNYTLEVFYEYESLFGKVDLNVFHKDPESIEISMITVMGSVYATDPSVDPEKNPEEYGPREIAVGGGFTSSNGAKYQITPKGKSVHVKATAHDSNSTSYTSTESDVTLEFDIDDVNAIATKQAKLLNVKLTRKSDIRQTYTIWGETVSAFSQAENVIGVESLPMTSSTCWEADGTNGLKITDFKVYSHTTTDDGAADVNLQYYHSELENLTVNIYFK